MVRVFFKGRLGAGNEWKGLLNASLQVCKQCSLKKIGIETFENEETIRLSDDKRLEQVREFIEGAGAEDVLVDEIVVHTPIEEHLSAFADDYRRIEISSRKAIERSLEITERVSSLDLEACLVLHPSRFARNSAGMTGDGLLMIRERLLKKNVEYMGFLADEGKKSGIKILVENMPAINDYVNVKGLPPGNIIGLSLNEIKEICSSHENLYPLFDTSHLAICMIVRELIDGPRLVPSLKQFNIEKIREEAARKIPESLLVIGSSDSPEFSGELKALKKALQGAHYMHICDTSIRKSDGSDVCIGELAIIEGTQIGSGVFPWEIFKGSIPDRFAVEIKGQHKDNYKMLINNTVKFLRDSGGVSV